jgi:putative flippase GtrA
MPVLDKKFQFLLIGASAFVVDASSYFVCSELIGLSPFWARFIAFVIAVAVTSVGNRKFTFSDRAHPTILVQYGKSLVAACISLVPNMSVFLGLLMILPEGFIYSLLAIGCGTVVGIAFNFLLSEHYVFKNTIATR